MSQTTDHQKSMARAYSRAGQELRRRHAEEFKSILTEIYQLEGIDIKRRRSQAEIQKDRISEAVNLLKEAGVEVEG